jgi:apolipoprotein N-acyltransferase
MAFCILFSLEPWGYWYLGILGYSFFFQYLNQYESLQKISTAKDFLFLILRGLGFSFASGIIVFHWMFESIQNLTELSGPISLILYFLFCLVADLKYLVFIFLYHCWKKIDSEIKFSWYHFAVIAFLSDILSPQIFPFYWGDILRTQILLLQAVSLGGIYLLGSIAISLGSLLSKILLTAVDRREKITLKRIPVVLGILLFFYSLIRYYFPDPRESDFLELRVLMIQPNLSYVRKEERETNQYVQKSLFQIQKLILEAHHWKRKNGGRNWDLAILPESAIPYFSAIKSGANVKKNAYSDSFNNILELTAKELKFDWIINEINWDSDKLYNQFRLVPRNSQVGDESNSWKRNAHQKTILFPFGETVPGWIKFLGAEDLFKESSNYSPGKNQDLIYWEEKGIYILPSICYESIFPEYVRKFFQSGSNNFGAFGSESENLKRNQRIEPQIQKPVHLFINLTNDSWFDSEIQAFQHMGSARVRSVENNLIMIRVTLSGVSGAWDPRGNPLLEEIGYQKEGIGILDVKIPRNPSRTFYTDFGVYPMLGLSVLILGFRFYRVSSLLRSMN